MHVSSGGSWAFGMKFAFFGKFCYFGTKFGQKMRKQSMGPSFAKSVDWRLYYFVFRFYSGAFVAFRHISSYFSFGGSVLGPFLMIVLFQLCYVPFS